MEILIRKVKLEDLDAVTQVEAVCFPKAEAAPRESFLPVSYTHLDVYKRQSLLSGGSCGVRE